MTTNWLKDAFGAILEMDIAIKSCLPLQRQRDTFASIFK